MSEKMNELILNVKEYLSLGQKQSEQSIIEIQNQIDDKNLEIRDIFSGNLDSVIAHYVKYQQIISSQRKIETMCQSFSQKISKTEGLSHYDQQMIERGEKNMLALKTKRQQLEQLRENVRLLKKAASSINEERYSNAIKQLNLYKQKQPQIDTPLKKTDKIFNEQIKNHLVSLIDAFWESNKAKIIDIGTHCYNKIQLSTHEKTNIYQAFFGRNSTNRNSLIRKSSIIDQGKGEAPLRFLKKIKDEEILEKFILRINVEMNSLKQTKFLCKEMKEEEYFQSILAKQTRNVVSQISKSIPCQTEADLKKLLANYIGFLLFRREINAFFCIQGETKAIFTQMYSLIGQQAKSLITKPQNISQIMKLKSMLDIFKKVLSIVDLDEKSSAYSLILSQIFKIYCSFSLEQYQSIISEQINEDNLMGFKNDNDVDQRVITETLGVKPPVSGYYNFTSFVMYVIEMFNQYYDRMVAFVKDEEFDKSQLHDHLAALLQRIIAVYGGQLVMKDHPLQISQGEVNLLFCEQIFLYFSNQLEQKNQYMRKSTLTYKAKLQAVIVELRRRVRQIVEEKIMIMMSSYEQPSVWLSQNGNKDPNEFVTWMMEFLKQVIMEMKRVGNGAYEEMAYFWVGHIVQLYWQFFEECRQFTLITVYNLDVDLMYIYKFLSHNFSFFPDIANQLKSLSQFYDLLLRNNIQQFLDKGKRDIIYSNVDVFKIIPILKKYNKSKGNAGGKVRDLKKKDLENVVKKLEVDLKTINAVLSFAIKN